ncbi:cation:proton antiporter [Nocardioides terrisoli]|uniref:cation:proton antiporter n=1 Tax=Nocardioides terrisoli TaxID=3388267 RepID=UPI00287B8AAB|nr:sodium:proton antiporter [Nocardioides marmorisolisilvae]
MVLDDIGPAPYLAVVLVVSVIAQWLAWQVRMPAILALLLVGFGLGRLVAPEQVLGREVLFGGVTIAVGIILFEGSMSLRLKHVRDLGKPVLRLCTVTVAIAWALITLTAWLLGFRLPLALLLGAILVVTGPTVIAPILRQLRPTRRVSSLLRWEGIVVDPLGALLAVLVFQGVLIGGLGEALPELLWAVVKTLLVSVAIALALGILLEFLMRRHAVPDFLHGVTFLAAAVGGLVGANAVQDQSGLLTVTILGVYVGNRPDLHVEHVAEFKEHLQVLFVGGLFVVLAGRISPRQILDVAPQALLFVLVLIVVVRPVSVLIGLWGTKVTRSERILLACMAPRGIVAAAVSSIFALAIASAAHDRPGLRTLAGQADRLVPVVFVVVVCTVAIYGFGVGRLAERLGLASPSPQGALFVGDQDWVVQAARVLDEGGIHTLVVSRHYRSLAGARMSGLPTVTANILSDYAVKDMELAGIGTLIACTPEEEVNATAAREFAHVLGRAHVYQLRRDQTEDRSGDQRKAEARHLSARFPFRPALSEPELEERVAAGMTVKRTRLSEAFTLDDFLARYGEQTVLMFAVKGDQLEVLHEGSKPPQTGVSVVALVHDRKDEAAGAG